MMNVRHNTYALLLLLLLAPAAAHVNSRRQAAFAEVNRTRQWEPQHIVKWEGKRGGGSGTGSYVKHAARARAPLHTVPLSNTTTRHQPHTRLALFRSLERLPRFVGKVHSVAWACYLELVYGDTSLLADEVLDISLFNILYVEKLAHCGLDVQRFQLPGLLPPYEPKWNHRCCAPYGSVRFNNGDGRSPRTFPPLRQHTWVEVMHCARGVAGYQGWRESGYWVYLQRGSGVFMNTGSTLGFDQHADALRAVVSPTTNCNSVGCVDARRDNHWMLYNNLTAELAAHGYDSLQFIRAESAGFPMEMLWVGITGEFVCGKVAERHKLRLRTGIHATHVFQCNPLANCTEPHDPASAAALQTYP